MKANTKTIILLTSFVMTFSLVGCSKIREAATMSMPQEKHVTTATANQFTSPTQKGPSSVETAMKMTEKYTKLSDDFIKLKQQSNELATENKLLKEQIAVIKPDLERTQKELNQANNLLIDMTTELNNWKSQVLGFKDEMRQADEVQLEALLKILEAIGGEVKVESIQDDSQKTAIQDKMKNLN